MTEPCILGRRNLTRRIGFLGGLPALALSAGYAEPGSRALFGGWKA
ncbi:MAG: hypothetical protein M0002_09470 [Rhodospirillales bacterium]|nr:hypothetical protein [Rhodospirillales bacterium]